MNSFATYRNPHEPVGVTPTHSGQAQSFQELFVPPLPWLLALILGGILLVVDSLLPLSLGNGTLYALLLLFAFFIPSPWAPMVLSCYATILLLTGFLISSDLPGVPEWISVYNRLFALIVIWVTAWSIQERQKAGSALQRLYDELEQRVHDRTKDLCDLNETLIEEIYQRREAERILRSHEEALEASQAALERGRQDLQDLTAKLLTAQEQERRRISHELHDDINQRLALLAMDLQALEQDERNLPIPIRENLRSLLSRTTQLSDDIRGLAYQFHPSILDDLGLNAALECLVDDFQTRTGIKTILVCQDPLEALPEDVASCLYRVVQESLSNIARHAQATRVEIELTIDEQRLELSIRDHGCGFEEQNVKRGRTGMGILNMQERVRALQGMFELDSKPGRGTLILITIPLSVRSRR
jgi:signal transduction histidine kinase